MQKKRVIVAIVPLVLLVVGLVRWQAWKRDNPPVTAADLKVRRILQKASFMQFGDGGGVFLSPAQKRTLIEHFWVAPSPLEATCPLQSGSEMGIYVKLPPGQGHITLVPDAAFSSFVIEHWSYEPKPQDPQDDFIPTTVREENYDLHPATNRFLRAWLQAGTP